MLFLTSEKEFIVNNNKVVYFYSTEMIYPLAKVMFSLINLIEKNYNENVLCVDVSSFKNLSKRCKITELPTFILYRDGQENKRFIGVPTFENIKNLIAQDI